MQTVNKNLFRHTKQDVSLEILTLLCESSITRWRKGGRGIVQGFFFTDRKINTRTVNGKGFSFFFVKKERKKNISHY